MDEGNLLRPVLVSELVNQGDRAHQVFAIFLHWREKREIYNDLSRCCRRDVILPVDVLFVMTDHRVAGSARLPQLCYRKQNRIALFYLFQNSTPISDDLTKLEFFYNLGVRSLQLTYNTRNLVGDGCMERTNAGLSEFGLKLIDRMNALGLLIDLSHGGEQTIADAAHFSQKPIVISHSGCKAVYNHPRNVSDENLKRLANAGGVIGIYQINPYLGAKERNNLDDYLRHIDHAVNVAGVEHVGIGSDREHQIIPDTEEEKRKLEEELARLRPKANTKVHWPFFLSELNHPRRMETIWDGLKKRGHAASKIEKILGGNFYRVYKEVIG